MKPFKLKEANAKADYSVRELVNNIFDSICNVIKEKPYLGKMTGSQSGFGYFANITKSLSQYSDLFKNDKVYIFITEENESNPASFEKHSSGSLLYMRVLSEDLLNELAVLAMDKTKANELNKVISTKLVKVLEDNRSDCIHELIHALDHKRLKNYKGHREEYYTNDSTYINDPLEFNAWFQSHLSEIDGIGDYFDDFKKSWQAFYGFCLDSFPFIRNYNEKYRRKFDVRLYKYWKEFIKDGGKKQVNESLKNEGGFFITNSGRDILNLLQNKPKEYRIVYDANLGLFMICDANEGIHADMLEKAYKNGLYYNMDKFIDSLGSFQNYIETGQDGGWDENDNEINSFLYYMVFDPTGQWEIGDDDYDTVYKLPYGNLFTRKCDLSEIPFYNMLPLTEQLNEGVNTQYLYHAMWKKQFLRCKKDNRLYSHIAYENYKTAHRTIKGISTSRNVDVCIKFMERAIKEMTDEWKKDPNSYFPMNDTGNDGTTHYIDKGTDLSYVVLVFDRNKLKQNHKIIPHNYIGGRMRDTFGDEQEELIVGDLPNFMNYVVDVMEFNNNINSKTLKSKKNVVESFEPKLNDNFWKWFGKSICRDEKGNPIVFYHGTPNADLPELRGGTYFTQNKDYADGYQDQFASMLTRKKEARKPGTYAVYLKIENPFDTRKKKCRDEFYKYYYQQMGSGTDLQESGLPDWTDGRDLLEFLTEYHPELGYDGLLLDEGGNYDIHGGLVYRGISYLPLSSNQIKSVDNNGNWSTTSNNIYESITPKLNDNFWNWFNGSKIVDKKGNPLVCYHETNVDFDTFDINKQSHAANLGYGFYFSSEPFWSKLNVDTKYKKECYLKIKNPFNATKRYTIEEVKFLFDDDVYNDIIKNSDIKGKYTLYNLFSDTVCYLAFNSKKYSKTDDKEWYKMFYNNFQKAGYDGIKRYNSDYGMYEYVVFNPNQIKSVNNNGNWSSASNNINEWWSGGVNWQNDRKGLGGVGATQDCHLFFFMFPDQFLNLCPKFSYGDEKFFNQYVDSRKPLGIPFLWCEVDENNKTLKVLDHEGRHRVQAIRDYALSKGKSQPDIPVAIVYNKDKYSLPYDISELRKTWKIVSQNGDMSYNIGMFIVQNNLDNVRIGLDNLYESIELNDNFWKWFGNSKIVDKDGNPLICYHGTNKNFDKFEDKFLGTRTNADWSILGHFFTPDKSLATKFTKGKNWNKQNAKYPTGSNIFSVFLNIKNPLRIPAYKLLPLSSNRTELQKIKDDAVKNGYDGIIIGTWKDSFNTNDPTGELEFEQIVAFYSNQIKSVYNNGNWSLASDNINEDLFESAELNDNFWKWFGNSKTIKDGQPMVFYHGTPNAFTTFDISKTSPYGTVGQGFYFTDSKQTAENYIGGILDRKTPNSHVKSCYLRIENPYNLSDMITDEEISSLAQFIKTNNDDFWYKKILDDATGDYDETNYPKGFMFEEGYLVDPKSFNRKMLQNAIDWLCIEGALDNHNLNRDNVWFIMTDGFNTNSSKRALQRWLKQNGYDAVIYQIEGDNKGNGNYQNNCYVVFNPNQIKSVDNKGLYGLDNDDINEVLEERV